MRPHPEHAKTNDAEIHQSLLMQAGKAIHHCMELGHSQEFQGHQLGWSPFSADPPPLHPPPDSAASSFWWHHLTWNRHGESIDCPQEPHRSHILSAWGLHHATVCCP